MIRANVPKYKVKGHPDGCFECVVAHFVILLFSANAQSAFAYIRNRVLLLTLPEIFPFSTSGKYMRQIALLVAEIRLEFVCEYFMTTLGARGPRGKGIMKRELSPALVLPRTFVRAVVQPGGLDHLRISTNRVGRAYLS
jgi:hypothetical protein